MSTVTAMIGAALRRRLQVLRGGDREDGWVLVVALTVMVVMLGFGMAILAISDTQSRLGGTERQRDSSFAIADGGLNTELFSLAQNWPGPGTGPTGFPTCTQASTDSRCPSKAFIQGLINSPDTNQNLAWQFSVYDNGFVNSQMQSFYSDAYAAAEPHYDADGDGKVWVRASVTAGSVTKTVVALVQTNYATIPLPRAAIVAGSLQTTNNGNKVIIDTQGSSAPPPGTVYVRCNPATNPNCLVYQPGKNQIYPDTTSPNYSGGSSLTAAVQAQLLAQAKFNNTYYPTCPPSLPSGAVVWIDSGNCSYTDSSTVNSPGSPGLLIINNGTISLGGTITFYGLIYALNPSNLTSAIVTLFGNFRLVGAIFVDGSGSVYAGSSLVNLTFDAAALNTVQTLATVGGIQSTWRQL